MTSSPDLLRTPLFGSHEALGARLAPFGGWLMPIQYEGIVAEHLHTRSLAGLFDLSHMGRLSIRGPDAEGLVQLVTTNDARRLAVGAAQYSLLCNDAGGVIDDVVVYRQEDGWQLVVNAANRGTVVAHLEGERDRAGLDAGIDDRTFATALIGLQGPASEAVLQTLVEGDLSDLGYYRTRPEYLLVSDASPPHPNPPPPGGRGLDTPAPPHRSSPAPQDSGLRTQDSRIGALVGRTGYTGEDGFELLVDARDARRIWDQLRADARVKPVGLGARDTLRLEAGMCLYGHELSETISPFEAGLGRVVRLDKGPFVGRDALSVLSQQPLPRKLVGLRLGPGALPRAGCAVTFEGEEAGEVASGTFSPTLRCPIATAFVRPDCSEVGADVAVVIRGAPVPAHVVSLPFVPHRTRAQPRRAG